MAIGRATAWMAGATALAGAFAFLIYGVVDQATSLDHARSSWREAEADRKLLAHVLFDLQRDKEGGELLRLLERHRGERLLKADDSRAEIGDFVFEFRGGRLIDVRILGNSVQR